MTRDPLARNIDREDRVEEATGREDEYAPERPQAGRSAWDTVPVLLCMCPYERTSGRKATRMRGVCVGARVVGGGKQHRKERRQVEE